MVEQITANTELLRCDKCGVPGGGGTLEHGERAYARNLKRAQLMYRMVQEQGWAWDNKTYTVLCPECQRRKR